MKKLFFLLISILLSLLIFGGCGLRITRVKTSYEIDNQGQKCIIEKEIVLNESDKK